MNCGQCQEGRAGCRWAFGVLYFLTLLPGMGGNARAAEPATAHGVIVAIEFVGNKVTREKILRQEMSLKEGDVSDPVQIEISRQAIMDLGLFTSVRFETEPRAEGVLLRVTVKEKYYILPVPKLNRDDDNKFSYGAEISFDNLSGLNQKLKLRYEEEDSSEVVGEKTNTSLISYNYPRLNGSPWTLGVDISKTHSPLQISVRNTLQDLDRDAWTASVQASRWLNESGPSQGWQLGGGLIWRRNVYDVAWRRSVLPEDLNTQVDPYRDAQAVGFSGLVQFVDVRDFLYSRSGVEYGYSGELAAPILGSDTHYTRHDFFYRKYISFPDRLHENIDVQARLGLSSGNIFANDSYSYSLGGSKTLRGYKTGSFLGNSYVLLNAQYLRPFFGYYELRGVLFFDIGNVYPSNTEINLGDLKWDVGVGIRWRLKSFIKIDLRVDAAYSHDREDWEFFAGTKEIF